MRPFGIDEPVVRDVDVAVVHLVDEDAAREAGVVGDVVRRSGVVHDDLADRASCRSDPAVRRLSLAPHCARVTIGGTGQSRFGAETSSAPRRSKRSGRVAEPREIRSRRDQRARAGRELQRGPPGHGRVERPTRRAVVASARVSSCDTGSPKRSQRILRQPPPAVKISNTSRRHFRGPRDRLQPRVASRIRPMCYEPAVPPDRFGTGRTRRRDRRHAAARRAQRHRQRGRRDRRRAARARAAPAARSRTR